VGDFLHHRLLLPFVLLHLLHPLHAGAKEETACGDFTLNARV
jgi:hypothetical protein